MLQLYNQPDTKYVNVSFNDVTSDETKTNFSKTETGFVNSGETCFDVGLKIVNDDKLKLSFGRKR